MANDKIYPIDMNPKDILLQNEGGGGMIMNDQFIGIVGNMLPNQKELLDGQDNVNGTNIQTDKFSSNIIITNASSNPIAVGDLGSKNFDSLDQSIGTDQVLTPAPNDHCGGENLLNYEFQEASINFSLWEEVNSNGGGKLNFFDSNNYLKTESQLKKLLFTTELIDIIKKEIPIDGTNFKNLGWNRYGSGSTTLQDSIAYFYDNYFISNEKNSLGKIKDNLKLMKNNFKTNKFEVRSIFDIQTLPSGLRTMALQNCYNSGDKWISRILTTIGPDRMNILNGILGITIQQSKTGGVGSLSLNDKTKKFFDQYDDIINAYNNDKTLFLQTLATETKEWYGRLVDQGGTSNDTRYKQQSKTFKEFYNVYVDIALATALKYADCPNEYEVTGDAPATPTPSPSVASVTNNQPPPTKSEEEEGIYDAEFLPATEDSFQLFDDEYTANAIVLDAIAKDPSKVKNFQPKTTPSPNSSSKVDFAEISQWVKMYDQVQKDYNNGWTHPTYGRVNINNYLLQSIASACKATGIVATITTSKTGHDFNAKGGAPSRHHKGTGVDIAMLNGIWGYNKQYAASGPSNMVPEFKRLGTILKDQLVADGHTWNIEKGNDKAVLFMTYTGGNHYNHLHVSNRILSAPGVKPKIIRE
jgi:hypothetical protein